ncbi:MAG: MFS transporter [Betaproteobacteria bacterium]|nr:MFS transporter [Betaproteobacteria bacterium]NBY05650.1 MFS transporter [Betaproteobacteria bacterium]
MTSTRIDAAQKRAILLLSLATFSSMAVQRICDAMLPDLARVFGAPLSQVGHVISFYAVTHGLMQLIYGPLGDRWGKYQVVMLTTVGCSAGALLCAVSQDLDQLVLARIITAMASAAIVPLALAWVGDQVSYEQRQETLARVGLGTMLGLTAGQWMGGLLTETLGWRWAFGGMSMLFAMVALLLWRDHQRVQVGQSPIARSAGFVQQTALVLGLAWSRKLLLIGLGEGATVFGMLTITAAHLHHTHGLSLTLAGGTSALFGLGGMLFMATAKPTIARLGEVRMAACGGAALVLSFACIASSPWWALVVPACFFTGYGFAMFHNTLQAKVTQMVPQARGTAVTLFASGLFLGQSMGVTAVTQFVDRWESAHVMALVDLCLIAVVLIFVQLLRDRNATALDHA